LKGEDLEGLCCGYDGGMDYVGMKGYYGPNARDTAFGMNRTSPVSLFVKTNHAFPLSHSTPLPTYFSTLFKLHLPSPSPLMLIISQPIQSFEC